MGILFYNTLFDENAACHFALGKGFPECIENGLTMTPEQLEQKGMNDSATHVDFMFGTGDLCVTGFDKRETPCPCSATAAGQNRGGDMDGKNRKTSTRG